MMEPAVTAAPSKRFTPRRCAFESRPLRVDPPPLVLDISGSSAFGFSDCDSNYFAVMAVISSVA